MAECIGKDERGWHILHVPVSSSGSRKIIVIDVEGKELELVSQDQPMRVYVNPYLLSADEWEMPVGSGNKLFVMRPEHCVKQGRFSAP